MMCGAVRSMGRRSLAATGPLPSRGRPSGSMMRPSNPSPTATSMTRPVRSTSSPACRCQYSPSSTTPISASSTLNAMPSKSPGNFTNSSKPTAGRPGHLGDAGGDAGDRAYLPWRQLRRKCFPRLSIPANARSKTSASFRARCSLDALVPSSRSSGLDGALAPRSSSQLSVPALGSAFGFRFVLFLQKLANTLFQRHEVVRDAPGYFLSLGGEFDATDQVRRSLEPDVTRQPRKSR